MRIVNSTISPAPPDDFFWEVLVHRHTGEKVELRRGWLRGLMTTSDVRAEAFPDGCYGCVASESWGHGSREGRKIRGGSYPLQYMPSFARCERCLRERFLDAVRYAMRSSRMTFEEFQAAVAALTKKQMEKKEDGNNKD